MKKCIIMTVVSFLYMNSIQAMEPQRSQQFSLTNKSDSQIVIEVWQINLKRVVQKLIYQRPLEAGANFSFNVGAKTGVKCSLVVNIVAKKQFDPEHMWASPEPYYLSGESNGNNFFVNYEQKGFERGYLFPSQEVATNNVIKIFPLPHNQENWERFKLAMQFANIDLDTVFFLTGKK